QPQGYRQRAAAGPGATDFSLHPGRSRASVRAPDRTVRSRTSLPSGKPTLPLVEVRLLNKRFGAVVAVDNVSFSVEKGEVLGFLGPNGAGKSTTMKVIAGVLPPTSGTALVAGEDVRSHAVAAKRKLGYLPEGS